MKIKTEKRTVEIPLLPGRKDITRLCRAALRKGGDCVKDVRRDVRSIREKDPAAESNAEVLLLYSGLHATLAYRPRPRSAKGRTQLHGEADQPGDKNGSPGWRPTRRQRFGRGLFIDHGSGVVIGETAEVGRRTA